MMTKWLRRLAVLFLLLMVFTGCIQTELPDAPTEQTASQTEITAITEEQGKVDDEREQGVQRGEVYYTAEDVAEYLHLYGELPPNYLTKSEAADLGWESAEGNLWDVTDRGVIGGDRFGNREKLLPVVKGRSYFECDVNYSGGRRGAERLVYSDDGWIYYTKDHYGSFEELYRGEEK
ncbi:MAG: ribonuclease domain-containing protein [Tissierellia bacterium]|nr:ribonuclease domain-containing protein [Tissierellia bacterium]